MIQAVLFDFNGIIINDEPLQMKAYTEVLSQEGITLTEADYYSSLGMDDRAFVRAAYESGGIELSDEVLTRVIEGKTKSHRAQIEDELPLFDGVVTLIKALGRRYPLGIVSMAQRSEIEYILERAKLARFFNVIISAEDVRANKPDPDCYNRAFRAVDDMVRKTGGSSISHNECLVIEDSPPGIRAARSAGMRTLGVTNTVNEVELRAAGAEVVTPSLADWTVDAVRHVFD